MRDYKDLTEIIIHCSATAEGRDFHVGDIRKWHKAQGWLDVGYHYVIAIDGTIEIGRPIRQEGAHCSGHNKYSVGVCYIGGLAADGKTPKDTRTDAQKKALIEVIKLIRRFTGRSIPVYGHRDFANKACPSFDATKEYKNL